MSIYKLSKSIQKLAKSDDNSTPRKEAAQATAEALTGDEYKFARKSKIKNKGEDIAHSARHKVNQWKGLAEAEKSGQADKLVKLDTMLKHDPPNIMPVKGERAMTHLAAHYAMSKFPKTPSISKYLQGPDDQVHVHEYDKDGNKLALPASVPPPIGSTLTRTWTGGEIKQRARQIYVDAYKAAKSKAEELAHSAESPAHVVKGMRSAMNEHINKLREGSGSYQRGMDATLSDMLIDYHNKALRWGHRPRTSVYGALGEFETAYKKKYGRMGPALKEGTPDALESILRGDPQPAPDQSAHDEYHKNLLNHVTDVMSGKPVSKSFGLDPKDVKRFDPAEAYVNHAERNGPEYGWKDSAQHDEYLMNTAKMRALQYGNSVTDSEREHHLKHAAHAMRDMVETLGLPHQMASYNGRLGFAIGARGHGNALAHYEPSLRTINLTRKSGVGSLAHEWGHFFDNVLPETVYGHGKTGYGSEEFHMNPHLTRKLPEAEQPEAEGVRGAMHNVMEYLNNEVKHRIRRDYQKNPSWAQGLSSDKLHKYWLSGRELFARTFEKYIDQKMRANGRHNTYLSGANEHPLWPSKEEIAKVTPHLDKLFENFRNSQYLKKSMATFQELKEGSEKNKPKEVASIAVLDGDRLLMGRRNDNQRWTLPGGHLNTGENPCDAAARELAEETGIAVKSDKLVHLGTEEVTTFTGKKMIIHSFVCFGHHKTDSERDPDQEVQTWKYIDVSRGVPDTIMGMLHSPKNTTLKLLGLQDEE